MLAALVMIERLLRPQVTDMLMLLPMVALLSSVGMLLVTPLVLLFKR